MPKIVIENPILNSPYDEPRRHFFFDEDGITDRVYRVHQHAIQIACDRGCGRMEWTCLDWNKKAQAVYERLGARHLSEWYLYRLTREHFVPS